MKNIYLLLVVLFFPIFSFGQVEQLTTYQKDDVARSIRTHQYNNRVFYSYKDQSYAINIYEIISDSLHFVFEVPLSICTEYSPRWYFYDNKVIIGSRTRISGYNFLSGEELFDEEIDNPFSSSGTINYNISKAGVLSGGNGVRYDLVMNQFVDSFGGIYYRKNNFYYYKRDDAIYKRNTDDLNSDNEILLFDIIPESTTRSLDSLYISYLQSDTVVYIFNPDETISYLQKDSNQVYNSPMLLEDNKLSFVGNSNAIFLYDLSSSSLLKKISLEDENDEYNYPIILKSINGLVYYSWSHPYPNYTEIKTLSAYDYSIDSVVLNLDLTTYDIGKFWGGLESVDSYIFGMQSNRDSILAFNCNTNTHYLIENKGFTYLLLNGFTDDQIYFFDYGTLDNYPDLYLFDPSNDSLKFLNNPSLLNFGLDFDYNLEISGNQLYDTNESQPSSKRVKIYDENIVGQIKSIPSSGVIVFEDNFYYIVYDNGNCNLVVYNTSSSEETVLLPLDDCFYNINIIDNYIRLPFNSTYPQSIYNIYTGEVSTVTDLVYKLATNYLGNEYSIYSQNLYEFNIQLPNDYEIISEIHPSYKPRLLGDDLVIYRNGDSLFYTNHEDKYFVTEYRQYSKYKQLASPDNEKILFIDGSYETDNINIKIIDSNNGQVFNEVQIENAGPVVRKLLINNSKILYKFISGYNDPAFFLIDFEDNSIIVSDLVFNDYYDYNNKFAPLGVYNNNFYTYSKITNEIVIYNAYFVEIERQELETDEEVELILSSKKCDFQINKMPCLNKKDKDVFDLGFIDFENFSYTKIIGCEEGVFLDDYILKDSTIYFKGTNKAEGTQIYSYTFEGLITDVEDKVLRNNDFVIFPNPTSNLIVFENTLFNIKIYNSKGTEVLNKNDCKEVDVSKLIEGVYFIVYNDGSIIKSTKFVKN